jgi:hypothetical protein
MGRWAQVQCACGPSCDHASGILVETSPGKLLPLGTLLGSIFRDSPGLFEIYPLISDPDQYADEHLEIDSDRALLWKMETEVIRVALVGLGGLPYKKVEQLVREWYRNEMALNYNTRERIRSAQESSMAPGLPGLLSDLPSREPTVESAVHNLLGALEVADTLCDASIKTRQPVELLW